MDGTNGDGAGMATDVYAERLRRAQAEMARQGVDALVVGPSPDLRYLVGYDGHLSERLSVLLLPQDGRAAYVVPTLEAPLLAPQGDLLDVLAWGETDDPAAVAARAAELGDRRGGEAGGGAGSGSGVGTGHRGGSGTGHGAATVAVGDRLWSAFLLRLQAALPGARWVEATPIMRPLRMVKDAREIELLREASRRTDEAWEAFIQTPIAGLTELQAVERLLELTHGTGLGPSFGHCGSGPHSASPHHQAGDRVIAPGDAVVFDWGGTLEGYTSDVTRTVVVGEPSDAFVRVYETVLRANRAALAAVRPGVACQEIDRVARGIIEEAGYGDGFIHRIGHGLGLDVHEEPYLVEGNDLPLAPGMVFSDEPGVYLPGRFGVRIEDTVVCTETGGEELNLARRELTVVG